MNPTACELYRLLAELASLFSREEANLARELGLSPFELQCLCAVRIKSPGSIGDLSQILHKGGSQLSRILDSLEDKGLILRSLSKKDRRIVCVVPTERGTAAACKIEEWGEKLLQPVLEFVPSEEVDGIRHFVRLFIEMNHEENLIQRESRSKE